MSMDIDISDLVSGLEALTDKVFDAAIRGGGKAGSKLMNDATQLQPKTPAKEGTLRGSGSVFVNNDLTDTAPNVGGTPTPASVGDDELSSTVIHVSVGYNTPYAAYQHEGVREDGTHQVTNQVASKDPKASAEERKGYTDEFSGAKFLEKPLFENADDYIKIAQAEVSRALK